MWRSFGISKKIYISLGILLAGYFFSMLLGFLKGIDTEERLQAVHLYLSPEPGGPGRFQQGSGNIQGYLYDRGQEPG